MRKSLIDRMIEPFAPQRVANRLRARAQIQALQTVSSNGMGYGRHGASEKKKSLRGWISRGASPDEDIVENLDGLRERSRDLYMGSPLATGALKRIRTNVVGSGLMPDPQIDYRYLGMTQDQAEAWERTVMREWHLWAGTTACDAARNMTFGQLQSLTLMSCLMNGDVFAAMPVVERAGSPYDIRVQLIEGDRVCNPSTGLAQGKDVLEGVEVGLFGEPEAYWIAKYHPGSLRHLNNKWTRIPAYGGETGRRNILHIYQDMERVGQRRGIPLLAPVMEALKQLTRYTEAELMASVVAGMFTVFVKTDTGMEMPGMAIPPQDQVTQHDNDPTAYELGNGAIVSLAENESIEIADPKRPSTAFDGFVMALCRWIGGALEIPQELLVQHFTASYSASRAALLEAWKMFRMRRKWLVDQFCQPVYEEWLAEAVAKGRIDAPGFFNDPAVRAAWCAAQWYGPGQGQLNPLQEANAAKVRVEEGFSTRSREALEISGVPFEQVLEARWREEARPLPGKGEGATQGAPAAPDFNPDAD